jgi:hypothetical protein
LVSANCLSPFVCLNFSSHSKSLPHSTGLPPGFINSKDTDAYSGLPLCENTDEYIVLPASQTTNYFGEALYHGSGDAEMRSTMLEPTVVTNSTAVALARCSVDKELPCVRSTLTVPQLLFRRIDKKTLMCMFEECGKMFTRLSDLRRHHSTIHTPSVSYLCPVQDCLRRKHGFARKDKRDEHVRKIHHIQVGNGNGVGRGVQSASEEEDSV